MNVPLPRLAALLVDSGEAVRSTLRAMAAADDQAAAWCGLRGLAALRDPALVPAVATAWRRWPAEAYLPARWAAFAAGGPDASMAEAFAPLVDAVATPPVAAATGDDGVRLLGEIDLAAARDALVALLSPASASATARVDAAIHALARQGDSRPRAEVLALGQVVVNGLGGNATFEEARRLGAAAFYLLVVDDAHDRALTFLSRLSPADQADTAAWTVQTLCERGVRHPADAGRLGVARGAIAEALVARGVRWDHLTRGAFTCPVSR